MDRCVLYITTEKWNGVTRHRCWSIRRGAAQECCTTGWMCTTFFFSFGSDRCLLFGPQRTTFLFSSFSSQICLQMHDSCHLFLTHLSSMWRVLRDRRSCVNFPGSELPHNRLLWTLQIVFFLSLSQCRTVFSVVHEYNSLLLYHYPATPQPQSRINPHFSYSRSAFC